MTVFGAAYDFGAAKLQLNLGETKYLDRKQSLTTIGPHRANWARPDYGGLHRRQGQRGSRSTGRRGRHKLFALGYVYNLSKRTAVYTTYSQIENNGKGQFSVTNSPAGHRWPEVQRLRSGLCATASGSWWPAASDRGLCRARTLPSRTPGLWVARNSLESQVLR